MYKMEELAELNLTDPIQIRLNQRGDVSQEQRNQLSNFPGMVESFFKRLWSNVAFLGLSIAGLLLLLAFSYSTAVIGIYIGLILIVGVAIVLRQELPIQKKRREIERDLFGNQVKQAPGHLLFHDGSYHADIGERKLLLHPKPAGLLPGMRYRFQYLNESGVVLSAEEMERMGDARERQSYQEILCLANSFNPGSLEKNRRGTLVRKEQWSAFSTDISSGLVLSVLFLGIAFFIFIQNNQSLETGSGGLLFLLCGGIFALIGLVGLFTLGRALIDLLLGKVNSVTGEGRRAARMARRRSRFGKPRDDEPIAFYYAVDEEYFRVAEQAYNVLVEGINYRVYYTPISKTMVGLEPLESPLSKKTFT